MKKTVLGFILLLLSAFTNAQGLENIIVEKYYVSDLNDASVNSTGGVLPVGSVTYRIFVDMLPGFKFQAVYGVPDHEMKIQTTTLFFNNEDRGATSPTYSKSQAASNTVMLDSWLSVGAACSGNFGVLKAEDDGVATVINNESPQVLQNADTSSGIPINVQDGMLIGTPEPVTIVGISTEIAVFDNQNDGTNGPLFSSWNGSWASLNGSVGPDTTINKVLIAQITTDGIFSFELNIQIGTPSGGVENYVARNPVANEILFSPLIYSSLPTKVNELDAINPAFVVYPNPTKDNISIEIMTEKRSNKNHYVIYDGQGRVMTKKELGTIGEYYFDNIDVSSFAKGQYIIELFTDGKSTSQSIKQNSAILKDQIDTDFSELFLKT
jgi:Secretion system C-terminal sorting domain